MPDALNGTDLSAEEFQDSLRLCYGLQPKSLPDCCNGCTKKFLVDHAMSCKTGGLVLLCHNDLVGEWHRLCAQALMPSQVSDEPLIHSGWDFQAGNNGQGKEDVLDSCGDVTVHGFWH